MRIAKVKIDRYNKISIPSCLIKANPRMKEDYVSIYTGRTNRTNYVELTLIWKNEKEKGENEK